MYRSSVMLSQEVWERTIEAVAAQASRQSNVVQSVRLVPAWRVFGVQMYWLECRGASLLASLEVVSWRFR